MKAIKADAAGWRLPGAIKDRQSLTSDWQRAGQTLIAGVVVREVKNVPTSYGVLTELYRRDWAVDDLPVHQAFQSVLRAGEISAWHAHELTTDRLFVTRGLVRIVLYDARGDSPTRGIVNELKLGEPRPALVVIPPKVWHGVQNISEEPSILINFVDRAYAYEDPDHWRLPPDSPEIPFRF